MSKEHKPPSTQMQISGLLHAVNYRWHRMVSYGQEKAGIDRETIVYGRILGHLLYNRDKNIYQKDLEKVVGLTKSAISTILTRLETRGYIERQAVENDARLKRIVLTPDGEKVCWDLQNALVTADEQLVRGLDPDEQQELLRMLRIINETMKEMEEETEP